MPDSGYPAPDTEPGTPPRRQWWAINGQAFMDALTRCHGGEDPDMVYLEYWAESETQTVKGEDA